VSNLKNGRIDNTGLAKLKAMAEAMGFPTQLRFGGGDEERVPDAALSAVLEDETAREILGEVLRLGPKDRRLMLGIAREISASLERGQGPASFSRGTCHPRRC
jgi:hypothetical protein